jgi:hypothetical protein
MTKVVSIDGGKIKDDDAPCLCCGADPGHHIMLCPRVARLELFEDGTLAAVEYFPPGEWQLR